MGVIFKNNVMYGAGDIEISPVCYSEEEREIGCWVDGKPLYQKTLILSNTTINLIVEVDLSSLSINTIVDAAGEYDRIPTNNDLLIYPFGFYQSNNVFSWLRTVNNNKLSYLIQQQNNELTTFQRITIKYTKTTDTAGSGTWTPSGVPAVHYSTSEQVVGTWVDGSTLYEKTLTFTISSTVTTLLTDNSIKLIDAKGVASKDNAGTKNLIFPYYDAGNDYMMIQQNNGTIAFYCTNWFISNTPNITATIQYTKTTT